MFQTHPTPSKVAKVSISRKIKLYANFFKIQSDPLGMASCFKIIISPELPEGDSLQNLILQRSIAPISKILKYPVRIGNCMYVAGNQTHLKVPAC
jgi:hypothetical protein